MSEATRCSIDGCENRYEAKGLCRSHYRRLVDHGDPLKGAPVVTKPACTVEDCEAPICARGWCRRHYRMWQRHGDALHEEPTYDERMWSKIALGGVHDRRGLGLGACWEWTGVVTTSGYGQFTIGHGKMRVAHRAVYERLIGPVPDGLVLDHLCVNRSCVNPAHMEPVTQSVNVSRVSLTLSEVAA